MIHSLKGEVKKLIIRSQVNINTIDISEKLHIIAKHKDVGI